MQRGEWVQQAKKSGHLTAKKIKWGQKLVCRRLVRYADAFIIS